MGNKEIILIVTAVVLILVLIFLSVAFIRHWHRRTHQKKETADLTGLSAQIVQALGGLNNVLTVEAKMSRLTLSVADSGLTEIARLTDLGLTETIVMEKKITIVVGEKARTIAEEIQLLLNARHG